MQNGEKETYRPQDVNRVSARVVIVCAKSKKVTQSDMFMQLLLD